MVGNVSHNMAQIRVLPVICVSIAYCVHRAQAVHGHVTPGEVMVSLHVFFFPSLYPRWRCWATRSWNGSRCQLEV